MWTLWTAHDGRTRPTTCGWERAWRLVKSNAWVESDAYESHCFDPSPRLTRTPSRERGTRSEPLEEILWAMEPGSYKSCCPCHEDNEASLSILITEEKKVLVNCFAGCDWRKIQDYMRAHG